MAEAGSGRVVLLSQSGRYLDALEGLDTPISVAVDNDGRILVGSKEKGSVEVYAADFTPLFKLGSGDGEFSWPNNICLDAAGRIYVVDRGNDIVMRYDSSGQFIDSIGSPGNGAGQFHRPVSMTVDEAAGEIIILDRQLVAGTSKQGARLQFFTLTGIFLRGFSRNGTQAGGMVTPQGITVDSAGRIYVTDSYQNAVMVYDRTGSFLGAVYDLENPLRAPLGIAINATNRLYVASRMADRIEVYGIDSYTALTVDPGRLEFSVKEGNAGPARQSISVRNSGTAAISWAAAADAGWLGLTDNTGLLDQGQEAAIAVDVDPAGLAAGEYTGRITVSAGPGAGEIIQVVLTVVPSPGPAVSPSSLTFASAAGTLPGPLPLAVANTGGAPLHWNMTADQPWLDVSTNVGTLPAYGTESVHAVITADAASLDAGTYNGTITVSGLDVPAGPVHVTVTLKLAEPSGPPGDANPPVPPPATWKKSSHGRAWTVVSQLDGVALHGIWGSSDSDIYAVGDSGTILHFDGTGWIQKDTGIATNFKGIWGTAAASFYIVGENGMILHYAGADPADVSPSFPGVIRNVWCDNKSTRCFAVGQDANIFDCSAAGDPWDVDYSVENTGSLNGIWGSSESDIYAVGDSGTILHFDGGGWASINTGYETDLHGVWGSAADSVFAVGRDGTILHYDGSVWTRMDTGTTATLRGIWGNADDDIYAVGDDGTMLLFEGVRWQRLETGIAEDLNDAWGGRKSEVYAVGSGGSILFGRPSFPWRLLLPALQHAKQSQLPAE